MIVEPPDSLLIQAESAYLQAMAEPRRGRVTAERVAVAARDAADDEPLVVALRAAGYAARELGHLDDAQRFLDEAARVARAGGLRDRLCDVLITSAAVEVERGRLDRARRVLADARLVGGASSRAEIDFGEGLLYDKVGDVSAAAASYRRALAAVGADVTLRTKILNNLALTIVQFGEYEQAETLLRQAIGLWATRFPAREGVATESLAMVAVASGRPVDALRHYQRAEQLLTMAGVQLVDLYLGKARALLSLRLLDEAAEAAARAVAQVDNGHSGPLMLAEALLPQARAALAQERFDDAVAAAERAERLFRAQGRPGWRARAALLKVSAQARVRPTPTMVTQLERTERTTRRVGDLPGAVEAALLRGDVCADLGRTSEAVAAFARAADAGAGGPALLRLQGRRAAARGAELTGDTRRLAQECRLGLHELAAYRATVASAELRARAAGHGVALAEIGLRAAMRAGRGEQIWSWLERARSVSYVHTAEVANEQTQPLLAELRAHKSRFEELSPGETAERAHLLGTITALEDRVRTASWTRRGHDAGWITPTVRALRALRADLGDRVLLQYGCVDGQLVAVAVTRERIESAELGSVAAAVASAGQLAFALRRLSKPRSTAATAAAFASARSELEHLSRTLLAPLRSAFDRAGEVVVSPVGELIGVPWSALPLLADRSVRIVPSATAWWHGRDRRPTGDKVVVVAGPGVSAAEDEIAEIARRYAAPVRLSGAAATTDALREHAVNARLIHVAAHGRLRSDSPMFSSLQLADGPLTVHDLDALAAPAHHWVLAACDLGNPGALAGPALEGVLATLLSGGAGAVIAAVASVPDLSTRDLMVALHDCLSAGVAMPESLRRARTTLDVDDPAGFVASTAFACYGGG